MAKKIKELRYLHDIFNELYFGNKLLSITLLAKRNEHKDGAYEYRAHIDWTPIRHELSRASIFVADGCWDEGTVEDTMLHEMIHQYQAEVMNIAPHHDATFRSWCRKLELEENTTCIR